MRDRLLTAGLFAIGVCATIFAAVARVAAQPPDLIGNGPRVEVRTGANGTLDVGGPRSGDLNVTGENLRGNFGASRPFSGSQTSPGLPGTGLPAGSFKAPASTPNFGPSLPSPSSRRDKDRLKSPPVVGPEFQGDANNVSDLILPRFRQSLAGGSSKAARERGDGWRYQFSGGRWWYWLPSESWTYWDGARWRPPGTR